MKLNPQERQERESQIAHWQHDFQNKIEDIRQETLNTDPWFLDGFEELASMERDIQDKMENLDSLESRLIDDCKKYSNSDIDRSQLESLMSTYKTRLNDSLDVIRAM